MFKFAVACAVPLVALGSEDGRHSATVKKTMEALSVFPRPIQQLSGAVATEEIPVTADDIWVGTLGYDTANHCNSETESGMTDAWSMNIGLPYGCSETPTALLEYYNDAASMLSTCNGTHISATGYQDANCDGDIVYFVNVAITNPDGCGENDEGVFYRQFCYYGQGDVWTETPAGYTSLYYNGDTCPDCGIPVYWQTRLLDICAPYEDGSRIYTDCNSADASFSLSSYTDALCTSTPTDTTVDFRYTECTSGLAYDDDVYGNESALSFCSADVPGSCSSGTAASSGVSFGLVGMMLAASVYFAQH